MQASDCRRKISHSRFQWLILNGILPDGRAAAVIGYDGDFRCRHFSDNGRRRGGASPSPIAISAPWTCASPGRGRAYRAGPASHQMVGLGLCQYATIAEPAAFRRIVAAEILAETEHEARGSARRCGEAAVRTDYGESAPMSKEKPNDDPPQQTDWKNTKQTDQPWKGQSKKNRSRAGPRLIWKNGMIPARIEGGFHGGK